MTAEAMTTRIANLMPQPGVEPFTEAAKRLLQQFVDEVASRPDQFPKTLAFMRSRYGKVITDADNLELGQLYAQESADINNN